MTNVNYPIMTISRKKRIAGGNMRCFTRVQSYDNNDVAIMTSIQWSGGNLLIVKTGSQRSESIGLIKRYSCTELLYSYIL